MNIRAIRILGGLGGIFRYSLEGLGIYGTLLVNVIGCFILGFFVGTASWRMIPNWLHSGVSTGFIGSFTTFASLTHTVEHLSASSLWVSVGYLAMTTAGGIVCGYAGEKLAYLLFRRSNQQHYNNQQQRGDNTRTVSELSWHPSGTEVEGD